MFERHLSSFDQTLRLELDRCVRENSLWSHILTLLGGLLYTYTGSPCYGYVAAGDPSRAQAVWRQIHRLVRSAQDAHPYNFMTWVSPSGVLDWPESSTLSLATSFLNSRERSQSHYIDDNKLRETTIYLLEIMRENL